LVARYYRYLGKPVDSVITGLKALPRKKGDIPADKEFGVAEQRKVTDKFAWSRRLENGNLRRSNHTNHAHNDRPAIHGMGHRLFGPHSLRFHHLAGVSLAADA